MEPNSISRPVEQGAIGVDQGDGVRLRQVVLAADQELLGSFIRELLTELHIRTQPECGCM